MKTGSRDRTHGWNLYGDGPRGPVPNVSVRPRAGRSAAGRVTLRATARRWWASSRPPAWPTRPPRPWSARRASSSQRRTSASPRRYGLAAPGFGFAAGADVAAAGFALPAVGSPRLPSGGLRRRLGRSPSGRARAAGDGLAGASAAVGARASPAGDAFVGALAAAFAAGRPSLGASAAAFAVGFAAVAFDARPSALLCGLGLRGRGLRRALRAPPSEQPSDAAGLRALVPGRRVRCAAGRAGRRSARLRPARARGPAGRRSERCSAPVLVTATEAAGRAGHDLAERIDDAGDDVLGRDEPWPPL